MLNIRQVTVGWGHEKCTFPRYIDTLIIHTMYDSTATGEERFLPHRLVHRLQVHQVAAHYIIARDGEVQQLVDDNDIAHHAGKSALPNDWSQSPLNPTSLGIEIANAQDTLPTDAQYAALGELVRMKMALYPIVNIKGHDTIALPPGRKDDPWNFDWQRFFQSIKAIK